MSKYEYGKNVIRFFTELRHYYCFDRVIGACIWSILRKQFRCHLNYGNNA